MAVSPSTAGVLIKVDTWIDILIMRIEVVENFGGSVDAFRLEAEIGASSDIGSRIRL